MERMIRPSIELTAEERGVLAMVAGYMIPASVEHGMPGADDPAILADIVASLDRDATGVRTALARILDMAGGGFGALPRDEVRDLLEAFRTGNRELAGLLEMVVARSYYADDRVMLALDLEPRPPFPKGYEVEQGDLALLDPVRARGPIWRAVDTKGDEV
ncbi:hypothetical protein [Seohaeicola zhoushanensis]|nr:hypothetical protein [Seohaeicola zhoushanensis]